MNAQAAGSPAGPPAEADSAGDALRWSKLEALWDQLPEIVIRYDTAGRMRYVNPAFVELTGVSRESALGRRGDELDSQRAITDRFEAARRAAMVERRPATFEVSGMLQGRLRHAEFTVIPEFGEAGDVIALLAFGRDVTEREVARAQLQVERTQLLEAQVMARMGSWTWDITKGTAFASQRLEDILGHPGASHDPVQMLFELIHPDDREKFEQRMQELYLERPSKSEGVWKVRRPDGAIRFVKTTAFWTYDGFGHRVGGAGTFQDVTEEVEGSRRLAQQKAMLEESQNLAGVGSWELDIATQTVTWSEEMRRINGLSGGIAELSLTASLELVHPDDLPRVQAAITRATTGQPAEFETRLQRPDGEQRDLFTRVRPTIVDGRVVRLLGTCQDITDRRRLEEQVKQGQRLEVLGLLVSSIAHDFNNLLSAIIGGAELARHEVADGSDAAHDLDHVRQAAARAARITQQLLSFGRRPEAPRDYVDIRQVTQAFERVLRRLLPEGVVLDVDGGTEPVVVRADPTRIEQAILNLVLNARDAIVEADTGGGLVSVRVGHRAATPDELSALGGLSADGAQPEVVLLSVHDTGVGMDAQTRRRIFEPFFTTKPHGKGTGIGLATVNEIARECGGRVEVSSEPREGATFTLVLPRAIEGVGSSPVGGSARAFGTETILVVEDEAAVRETVARILERHGYQVLTARHGRDALEMWELHQDEVQLVITDMRMPEMGGQELVTALRAHRPWLPILIMSGYASGRRPGEKELLTSLPFIAKPFTPESLLVQVRSVLSGMNASTPVL